MSIWRIRVEQCVSVIRKREARKLVIIGGGNHDVGHIRSRKIFLIGKLGLQRYKFKLSNFKSRSDVHDASQASCDSYWYSRLKKKDIKTCAMTSSPSRSGVFSGLTRYRDPAGGWPVLVAASCRQQTTTTLNCAFIKGVMGMEKVSTT